MHSFDHAKPQHTLLLVSDVRGEKLNSAQDYHCEASETVDLFTSEIMRDGMSLKNEVRSTAHQFTM
jgi:hypothetical protein